MHAEKLRNLHLNAGQKLIGYVGQITDRKGVEYLIKAMPSIKNRFQNISLVIIGGRKDADTPYFLINKLIEELSLQEIVHFTGSVSSPPSTTPTSRILYGLEELVPDGSEWNAPWLRKW